MSLNQAVRPIILVVDDTPENIDVLKGSLVADYTVRPAPNGPIALKAANIRPCPDLVLLDIMMPGMDGYEVCRRLKAQEATRDVPVIFVTAKSEEADELEGLKLGAVDYITKPFSVPIVMARVKTHLALRSANQKLDEQNRLLRDERALIENIVVKMRGADALDGRRLRHLISPVEVTAGDILLSTFTPEGRQLVLLGDFTGHGLPAAIGGPLVTYIFHDLAARSFSGQGIIEAINTQLHARLPTGIFFACVLINIVPSRDSALLWNAGLPESLLIRHGQIKDRFPSTVMPLGIAKELAIKGAPIALEPGDRLYAFSDGIVEDKGVSGEMFGMERLEGFLLKITSDDVALNGLLKLLNAHAGASIHADDITLVEVRI